MVDVLARVQQSASEFKDVSGDASYEYLEVTIEPQDVDEVLSHPHQNDQSFVVLKTTALEAFGRAYPDVELAGMNALIVDASVDALSTSFEFDN